VLWSVAVFLASNRHRSRRSNGRIVQRLITTCPYDPIVACGPWAASSIPLLDLLDLVGRLSPSGEPSHHMEASVTSGGGIRHSVCGHASPRAELPPFGVTLPIRIMESSHRMGACDIYLCQIWPRWMLALGSGQIPFAQLAACPHPV
jgi:hypothetical protein